MHTVHSSSAIRWDSSLSPHRWSAQWENHLPGVPSRQIEQIEQIELWPAVQQAEALPTEQSRTFSKNFSAVYAADS